MKRSIKRIALFFSILLLLCAFAGCKRELTEAELARYAEIDAMIAEPHKDGEITVVPKDGVTIEQLGEAFDKLDLPADFDDTSVFPFCSDRVAVENDNRNNPGDEVKTVSLPQLWFTMAVSENDMRDMLFVLSGCELIERAYPSVVYSETYFQPYYDDWASFGPDEGAVDEWYGVPEIEALAHNADERLEFAHVEDTLIFRFSAERDLVELWEFFERFGVSNDFCDETAYKRIQFRKSGYKPNFEDWTYYVFEVKVPPEELRDKMILAFGLGEYVYLDYTPYHEQQEK